MQSLPEAFRNAAAQYADSAAVISSDGQMDYRSLDLKSDALACQLAARGIEKDDRVGLYCMNGGEFAIAYMAILKAGATVVPLNLLISPGEMAYILEDSEAKGLIHHAAFAEQAASLASNVAGLSFCLSLGGGEVPEPDAAMPPAIEFDPKEDLAVILYTSGTTGKPKGAMLTHGNLLANVNSVRQAMQWRPGGDKVLVVLPMFHAFAATVGLLTPLLNGCAIAPLTRFEPELVARTIHETGSTIFLGVPSMFTLLLRLKPESTYLLESLRFCISGGAALPMEVLRRFEEQFGKRIYEGDGPTECSPVTCVNPISGISKPGTVGLPIPDVEMRILGEEGVESLPLGEVGEIAVRGPNIMKGYWKQPQATAEVMRDGWLLTGDLGTEDEDGYFSIVDRKKDLIIVNGMNVYPRMIEEVLYRHPAVREAAVVGELHDLHGEVPIAYVALAEPGTAGEVELRAWCRQHLGRHQIPKRFVILEQLPKNATGKILKRELRKHGEIERGVKDL